MNTLCALLLTSFTAQVAGSASVSAIGLPEAEETIASSSLLQGEKSHESVVRTEGLRSKISAMRAKNAASLKTKAAQGVTMAAASNLLDASKVDSLIQTEDESLSQAVGDAKQLKAKRVTLEELLVVEDKANNVMDSQANAELNIAFKAMMTKYKQCEQCDKDCVQLKWRKYAVHTMAQCKQTCKVHICKTISPDSWSQESEALEQAKIHPDYAKASKFSSYLENYNGEITNMDDAKFEIVWEMPSADDAEETNVNLSVDPVEQLRANKSQKSSEQILKELHQQQEESAKMAGTDKLVKALV